jgi:hypothetical protein
MGEAMPGLLWLINLKDHFFPNLPIDLRILTIAHGAI